jgi:hypothetical protein
MVVLISRRTVPDCNVLQGMVIAHGSKPALFERRGLWRGVKTQHTGNGTNYQDTSLHFHFGVETPLEISVSGFYSVVMANTHMLSITTLLYIQLLIGRI